MTSDTLTVLSKTVGWVYFFAWSISFYPQIYLNWKRKAVTGLSFEFQAYNLTGFLFYAIYTCINYWLQERDHPDKIAFEINDIAFSIHAFIMTVVTGIQILMYRKEKETINKWHVGLLVCMWTGVVVNVILGATKVIGWAGHPTSGYNYNVVEYLGYVKAAISAVKYTPQAYMNYKYQSTRGWSIGGVLLDLTGGTLSFTQQFIDAHNTTDGNVDWSVFYGNITKFLLAVESILFDIVFLIQHYILYRHAHEYDPHHELIVDASDSYRGALIHDVDGYHTPESHSAAAHYRINQSEKLGYDPHAGEQNEEAKLLNARFTNPA